MSVYINQSSVNIGLFFGGAGTANYNINLKLNAKNVTSNYQLYCLYKTSGYSYRALSIAWNVSSAGCYTN